MSIEGRLTLAGAAEELGVHYMTAYRYVRTGRLFASKEAGQWWVDRDELAALLVSRKAADAPGSSDVTDAVDDATGERVSSARRHHATMFRRRATVGDYNGAWAVISEALAGGATPSDVHLNIIGPAMVEVGELWFAGDLSIAEEHRASAVAIRVVGRMTPMFRRKGRLRLRVVVGSVSGEMHYLPSALLSDLLSVENFDVVDLGGNTPASVFIDTAQQFAEPVVIGMAGTTDAAIPMLRTAVAEVHEALPDAPIFIGGAAAQTLAGELDEGVARITTSAGDAVAFVEEQANVRA